ncbi:EAL domain-containing protein, partial [uncultured Kiloniella sp.]|uniref:EAL domain-containing protein n=1 Tax=uncultured Kiloniella sp. TaxID=1133091 RepID=UPI00262E7907
SIIENAGIGTSAIEIEVTESISADEERAIDVLKQLQDKGFKTVLDDFGTGYSSLSYLQRLPITGLKVDRAFVKSLGEDKSTDTVFKSVIDIASAYALSVVVEGVETEKQRLTALELGAVIGQGYFWHKPLEIRESEKLLRDTTGV